MSANSKAMKQIPMNVICFSDDGKSMYGFSKYYNEFFEVNLMNSEMRSLGRLDGEKDVAELIFQMEYYDEKIIFIPRFAEYLYIYDCRTGKQHHIYTKDILGGRQYNFAGFFFGIYDGFLYLVHRDPVIISKLDMKNFEYTIVNEYSCKEKRFLSLYSQVGKYIACFAMENNELLLFDAEMESVRQIVLPEKCVGFTRPFFDGEFIWLHDCKSNMVYKCSYSGKLLYEWNIKHNMDIRGLHMIFRIIDGNLYLFPNRQDCYFSIKNDEIVMEECKSGEDDICCFVGDDGKNPYFLCLPWDGKGYCPGTTTCNIINFKYRKLNLADKRFIDIFINFPSNWNEEERYWRIVNSYHNYFSGNIIRGEDPSTSFSFFLKLITYMQPKEKVYNSDFFKTGKTIFKKISNYQVER